MYSEDVRGKIREIDVRLAMAEGPVEALLRERAHLQAGLDAEHEIDVLHLAYSRGFQGRAYATTEELDFAGYDEAYELGRQVARGDTEVVPHVSHQCSCIQCRLDTMRRIGR